MTSTSDNYPLPIELSSAEQLPAAVEVSVLIPTYKHAAFIRVTLAGVLAQRTSFPFEVLVGDDASPDGTGDILRELQRQHPERLRILTVPRNAGPHRNMEMLISASRAPLIAHCDGDDLWTDPTKLETQRQVFANRPLARLVYHGAGTIDSEGRRQPYRIRRGWFSRVVTAREVILGDGGMMPTSSMMISKSVMVDEPTWQRDAPVGDYPLAIRAALEGEVIYLDREMCDYRVSVPHSWTSRHVATFDTRLAYARRIDAMLQGVVEKHPEHVPAARAVVSKYYSDVFLRYVDGAGDANATLNELLPRMKGHERLLAILAVRHGIRLVTLKDSLRKVRTLVRLVAGHLTTPRVRPSSSTSGLERP